MDLKVLIISERYWPDGGGGELATHLIVGILRRRFDITVVTGSRSPALLPGVKYVYEPLLSRWEKPLLWFNALRFARTDRFEKLVRECDVVYVPRFAFPVIPRAKELGREVVVHLHDYIPASYTAIVLAPYEEHKYRITREDVLLECMKGVKYCAAVSLLWWLPRLARRWMVQADKVICVSRRQAKIISDLVPELRSKIEVIYNPIPPRLSNIEVNKDLDDVPTFLYVGGDSYVKGFHVLLRALRGLREQGIKAKFIFTNLYDDKSLKVLRLLSERYDNLEIKVMGRIEYRKLVSLHRRSWALVFPSIWEETFGYAAVEASLLATIPVASRVGGVVEVLSDTVAFKFTFEPNNVVELIKKISAVSSLSSVEVKALGYALRSAVLEKFNPSAIEWKFLNLFSGMLHG